MKLEKFNKLLKVFIIFLSIVLILSIVLLVFLPNNKKENKTFKQHDCTKIGNFCSEEEIHKGIEVEVNINKNKKERFYVISNTETTMTLMMKENILSQVDWYDDLFNINGPNKALSELAKKTKSWDKVNLIDEYKYNDNGYLTYINNCQNNTIEEGYDCTTKRTPSRGYTSLSITDGKLTIEANWPNGIKKYTPPISLRARLITMEEINEIIVNKQLPKWLINDLDKQEGYWTLSSSTSIKTNYSQGAIAIANIDKNPSIESLFVQKIYEPKYKIGIRPVITVEKENK